MIFSSLEFLFLYLPAAFLIYYMTPKKFRNISLLALSFIFFAWGGGPVSLIFMIFATIINYCFGLWISKSQEKNNFRAAKVFFVLAVSLNFVFLAFFKYFDIYPFFCISFYSLHALSYIADIYSKSAKAQKNIASLGVYFAMFPKLMAGPVCRYSDFGEQISQRKESVSMFACGIRVFVCGLCKKVFFADTAKEIFAYTKALPEGDIAVLGAWLGLVSFCLYIYFELSGYCDMAIGLGKMFGFDFPENFNYPYVSRSISEFCKKWHISLVDWFLAYIWPFHKNKKGSFGKYLNMVFLWVAIGFWPGPKWNYLIFAAYFWIILILEKRVVLNILKKAPAFVGYIYSWVILLFGFLIFAFEDIPKGFSYLGRLFGFSAKGLIDTGAVYDFLRYLPFLALAAIGCTPWPKRLFHWFLERTEKLRFIKITVSVISALLFLICAAFLVDSGSVSFLYFGF